MGYEPSLDTDCLSSIGFIFLKTFGAVCTGVHLLMGLIWVFIEDFDVDSVISLPLIYFIPLFPFDVALVKKFAQIRNGQQT